MLLSVINSLINSVFKTVIKIISRISSAIIALFLSVLLFACSPDNQSNLSADVASAQVAHCIIGQSKCEFALTNAKAKVLFDVEKIIAEQPFNMIVKYQGQEKLKSITGYLEGVDMYMGKIPLFFDLQAITHNGNETSAKSSIVSADKSSKLPEQLTHQVAEKENQLSLQEPSQEQSQVFQTEVLIGSCSSAQMKWRIWLTFTTEKNIKHTKMFTVPSYRA
jgi:hypothetical protein